MPRMSGLSISHHEQGWAQVFTVLLEAKGHARHRQELLDVQFLPEWADKGVTAGGDVDQPAP
jgi:hypothetical protein